MKRILILLCLLLLTGMMFLVGCKKKTAGGESPDIEVWFCNIGFQGIEKGSPMYDLYKKLLGVGVISPYVEWNGGSDYLKKLNIVIAAGNIPNMFEPWNGIENDLAKNGAIADLTDLLPKYAPKLWKRIPESVWNLVKANDPTGKGRIYWVPEIRSYERIGGLIRQDWLDKLGLKMPKTQEEYVNVLRAFRDRDPNGNGLKDEIPTGGRQGARWMDHLFNMYGVAIYEGYPDWDIYNGELTYSATTQNAKDALIFMAKLFKEKLMDNETFLNDKSAWDGKVFTGKAGNYFHWVETTDVYLSSIYQNTGVKANIVNLPVIEAPGYEGKGFVTHKIIGNTCWVLSAKQDKKHLITCLKALNEAADESIWADIFYGPEGMLHKVENGKKIFLPIDKGTQQNRVIRPYENWCSLDFTVNVLLDGMSEDNKWMLDQDIKNVKELQKQNIRTIVGDGMPASVYEDYPDIRNHTLWQEYASKIIIGTYPISKFDEFVQKWNESGGAEVTKRVREWYARVKKQ